MGQNSYEKVIFAQLKVFPPFMKAESSLPCSQQLATGPNFELHEFNLHQHDPEADECCSVLFFHDYLGTS
jgi:hypothetical protein